MYIFCVEKERKRMEQLINLNFVYISKLITNKYDN